MRMLELYKQKKEIVNYLIAGVLTTLVSLLTYYFVINILFTTKTALNIQVANVISWIVAVLFAYFTNKIFVFESGSKGNEAKKEFLKFVISRLFTLFMDMALMFIFVTLLRLDDTIVKLCVQIIIIVANYILSKIIVFRKANKN